MDSETCTQRTQVASDAEATGGLLSQASSLFDADAPVGTEPVLTSSQEDCMTLAGEITARTAAVWRFRAGQRPRWRVREPAQERVLVDIDRSCAVRISQASESDSDADFVTRWKVVHVPFNVGEGNVGRQRDLYFKYFFGGIPRQWECNWRSEREQVQADSGSSDTEGGSGCESCFGNDGGSQAGVIGSPDGSSHCSFESETSVGSFIVPDGSAECSSPTPAACDSCC
jgi:hypothetical protein